MSRTALAYLQILLKDRWTSDVTGRVNPVPEPYIQVASKRTDTRLSAYDGDAIFINDGGSQGITAKSAGWDHREVESLATIDIRTNVNRGRLEGTRNENTNEAERYGGLRGEVQRILDEVRKGDQEYDWIHGYEWNDLSEDVGFQFYRGTWEVRLTQIASNIDPTP